MKLNKERTLKIVRAALKEDIGSGDVTTMATVRKTASIKASIVVNEDCVMCGIDVAEWVINAIDFSVRFKPQVNDGEKVYEGKEVAFLEGPARSILTAERTMLNFVAFLSGIATKTHEFVKKTEKYPAKIYDTRKTLPLLRYLEKYAVVTGGGENHRLGLWDQALVKDNHFHAGKLSPAKNVVDDLRGRLTKNIKIEVEVENLEAFKRILSGRPDIIMLDNMPPGEIKKAVLLRDKCDAGKSILLEASGGITPENIEEYAGTGVDRISIGSLTDSVESVDMSLETR